MVVVVVCGSMDLSLFISERSRCCGYLRNLAVKYILE